jgi:multidrug efflux pump subunit AcrA (membrane-fusion protein)
MNIKVYRDSKISMKRQIIILSAGFGLLALSMLVYSVFMNNKKERPVFEKDSTKAAYVQVYTPSIVPVSIVESGNLTAKHKVSLFSEVQGVLEPTKKEFRAGVKFNKGELILKIQDDEHFSTLQSQKSTLQNLIASIMPDIRLDFPESYEAWNSYLSDFDINSSVKELPKASTDKEKYFITGRNIYTNFYTVKNLEARLEKFYIRAPYSGVLTEALVTTGTLIRSGQIMGEFIDPSIFEVGLSINLNLASRLAVGETVELSEGVSSKTWRGRVSRINPKIDVNTQTLMCFIEVKGDGLKEGMFLNATIPGNSYENAFLISRKLLVDNKAVYVVEDNKLKLSPVSTLFFNDDTVVISGLNDGDLLLSRNIPGAFSGLGVEIINNDNNPN